MSDQDVPQKLHIVLKRLALTENFERPATRMDPPPEAPARNRGAHGGHLVGQLAELTTTASQAKAAQVAAGLEGGFGIQVEFESFPDIELAFESLGNETHRIELLNVRKLDDLTLATVFVPDGKLLQFENKITDYMERRTNVNGQPLDNRKLIDSIQNLRQASLQALWTDSPDLFPSDDQGEVWWEVWLPVRGDRAAVVNTFKQLAQGLELAVDSGQLDFPERTVLVVFADAPKMRRSMVVLNSIAELKRPKDTADFFDDLDIIEQDDWLDDLLSRTTFNDDPGSPYVCLLDTGVNETHPFLAPSLARADMHTTDPKWSVDDLNGHGTAMAGLSLAGDLRPWLVGNQTLDIPHRLESVKLLNRDGGNLGDSKHHGFLMKEAAGRPLVDHPRRSRIYEMSVTSKDGRDFGKPSAWSSAADALSADSEDNGVMPQLFIVSAGNILDAAAWLNSPSSNSEEGIHDPGQSWNALTVGAFTELTHVDEPGAEHYEAIAQEGGLSPFSTSSHDFLNPWPIKPDVVFEGGNVASDGNSAYWMRSLSLVTTDHEPQNRKFSTANATSAATALCANFAARLKAHYPDLRPETIRGLVVHSAAWTDEMKRTFLQGTERKIDYLHLLRHCGFGVPDLERAMWSLDNSLTLIAEDEIHPFSREGNNKPKLGDMKLHRLPWPLAELESMGEVEVEMRVTLSYFIEPNPSERGFSRRYRYESHGLRFEVKRSTESEDAFRARINAAARDADVGANTNVNDPHWVVGSSNRHKGSLHSDIWRGTAADLASRGVIAVYPVAGWWKDRAKLRRYNRLANYSLLVSITTPETDVDLYTPITAQVAIPIEV